jgi:sugar-specific transcriptional regulator TrmB
MTMGLHLSEQTIVKQLGAFDLTENDAKVYLFLARIGPSSAGVVARRLGTNRMNVYRTLTTLQEEGLVESTVGRPSKFSALPAAQFLNGNIEVVKAKISSLERSKEEITSYLENLRKAEPSLEEPKFRIVQGRKHVNDQIAKMVDETKSEICLIQTRKSLFRLIYSGIDDKLKGLHKKGVKVMVLTEIDEASAEAVRSLMDFAQIRHMPSSSVTRMILVDETEAFTSFVRDDSTSLSSEKELAMWVKAPDYVKSMKLSFDALWNDSTPAQQVLTTISTERIFKDGLDSVRKTLESKGWTAATPGKLTGESGVDHTFDLVATRPDQKGVNVVLDILVKGGMPQILAFNLKVLDVKPTVRLLAVTRVPVKEEHALADRCSIKFICATDAKQLEKIIIDEANKSLRKNSTSNARKSHRSN